MLNQTIIRIPLLIILIMLVALLISIIRQDIAKKRSFIIDVDKLNDREEIKIEDKELAPAKTNAKKKRK
ncbi:MAG: hypothetical protein A2Y40_00595 [Candidatus Margulisbacteria bacterium GWF2_35_9]|nr:MAG: hypothetical protein A2Y40_00595 [Candidatus Margulisbacteria bacterium GWF2_35_9]